MAKTKDDTTEEMTVVASYDKDDVADISVDRFFRDSIQGMFAADEDYIIIKLDIGDDEGKTTNVVFSLQIEEIDGHKNNKENK